MSSVLHQIQNQSMQFFTMLVMMESVFFEFPSRCFTEADLILKLGEAKQSLLQMEANLGPIYEASGCSITKNDAAFAHFSTHEIDPEGIEDNQIATFVNTALKALKKEGNYTKSQFKKCLKNQIITPTICVPKVATCLPFTTK